MEYSPIESLARVDISSFGLTVAAFVIRVFAESYNVVQVDSV